MKPSKKLESMISEYLTAKSNFKRWQEQERKLRLAILEKVFPGAGEGTLNEDFGDIRIKGVFKNNVNIDNKLFDTVYKSMSKAEKACFSFVPNISISAYKKLTDEERVVIDDVLEIKPGLPALEIKILDDSGDFEEWQRSHEG